MKIKSIELKKFGGLNNIKKDFSTGINVIYGENEAGKSTIALFIRSMLYGVKSNKKVGELTLRKRIIPYFQDNAYGNMTINVDGVDILISRTFGKTSKNDTIKIIDLITGKEIYIDGEPGEVYLGIDESVFLRTLYIDEKDSDLRSNNITEVKNKLSNLVLTGDYEDSFKNAEKELNEEIKSISNSDKRGKPGLLDILYSEIAALEISLNNSYQNDEKLLNAEKKIVDLKESLEALRIEKVKLKGERNNLRHLKKRENYSDLRVLIDRAVYLNNEIKKNDQMVETNVLNSLIEEVVQLEIATIEYSNQLKEYNSLNLELEDAQIHNSKEKSNLFLKENETRVIKYLKEHEQISSSISFIKDFEDKLPVGLKDPVSEYKRNSAVMRSIHKLIKFSPLLILVPILIAFFNSDANFIFLAFLIVVGLGLLINIIGRKVKKKIKNNLQTIVVDLDKNNEIYPGADIKGIIEKIIDEKLERAAIINDFELRNTELKVQLEKYIGSSIPMDLIGSINGDGGSILERYLELRDAYNFEKNDVLKKENKVSKMYIMLLENKGRLENLNKMLNESFQSKGLDGEILSKEIKDRNQLRKIIDNLENKLLYQGIAEDKKIELDEVNKKIMRLTDDLTESEIEEYEVFEEDINAIRTELLTEEKLEQRIGEISKNMMEHEIESVETKNLISNLEMVERPGQVAAIIEEKKSLISELLVKKETSELALKILRECNEEMEKDYLPRVGKKTSEIFEKLTLNKYQSIVLDSSFNIHYKSKDGYIPGDYLSQGTIDLLWFGLRMSLYDILKNGEEVPLIFDDSFIRMDDRRLESVLIYLKEIAERAQILIFTCQKRIEEKLEKLA